MSDKDDLNLEDELVKSIERLVKEETDVAKAFVDGQGNGYNSEKIEFNNKNDEFDETLYATRMVETSKVRQVAKEEKSEEINKAKSVDGRKKYLIIGSCVAGVVVIATIIITVIVMGNKNSYSYNYNKGMGYYNSYNYNAAREHLEKAYHQTLGKNNVELMLALYNCYNVTGSQNEAVDILKKIIEIDFDNEQAITALSKHYNDTKDGKGLNELINKYKDTECAKYINSYRVSKPTANKQPGNYEDKIEVILSAPSGCTVYYSIDGNNPSTNNMSYTNPIIVEKSTVIKAIAVNSFGVISDVSEFDYKINYKAPMLPVLSIESDTITEGTVIKITNLEAGDKAYYTIDGTTPKETSTEYKDGIVLQEGKHILSVVIINKNNVSGSVLTKNITVKKPISYEEAVNYLIKRMQELNIIAQDKTTAVSGGTVEFAYQSKLTISSVEMYYIRMDIKKTDGEKVSEYYGVDVSNGKTYKVSGSGDAMTAVQY